MTQQSCNERERSRKAVASEFKLTEAAAAVSVTLTPLAPLLVCASVFNVEIEVLKLLTLPNHSMLILAAK